MIFNHQELEAMSAAYEQAQARIQEKDRDRAKLHKKSIDTEAQVILFLQLKKCVRLYFNSRCNFRSKILASQQLEKKEKERSTIQKQLSDMEREVVAMHL